MRPIGRGGLRSPGLVIDLAGPGDGLQTYDTTDASTVYCLIRRDGWPTSIVFADVEHDDHVRSVDLWALASEHAERPRSRRSAPDTAPGLTGRDRSDVELTVAICTRDRLKGLLNTLRSLAAQTDPYFTVLVVDNSAAGGLAAELAAGSATQVDLRVVREPTPGLSWARNRAVAEVRTDYVAWIDDDEMADAGWVEWIKKGIAGPSRPDVVCGLMLPAELATPAQVDFERYGGFNKGRGLQPQILRAGTTSVPNVLYPLPNFGAGGNMTFRTSLLRDIGGFETRLGAGTLTQGGEETLALSLALDRGATVLHWPPAITWHCHRRDDAALERQFFGYSAGLSAYYMSLVLTSPRYFWRILMLVPRGVADFLFRARADKRSDEPLPPDFPVRLLQASRRGLLQGAWLYLRERARQRATSPAETRYQK